MSALTSVAPACCCLSCATRPLQPAHTQLELGPAGGARLDHPLPPAAAGRAIPRQVHGDPQALAGPASGTCAAYDGGLCRGRGRVGGGRADFAAPAGRWRCHSCGVGWRPSKPSLWRALARCRGLPLEVGRTASWPSPRRRSPGLTVLAVSRSSDGKPWLEVRAPDAAVLSRLVLARALAMVKALRGARGTTSPLLWMSRGSTPFDARQPRAPARPPEAAALLVGGALAAARGRSSSACTAAGNSTGPRDSAGLRAGYCCRLRDARLSLRRAGESAPSHASWRRARPRWPGHHPHGPGLLV
jgi:hypothetical protein